jgi:hypothetical protein
VKILKTYPHHIQKKTSILIRTLQRVNNNFYFKCKKIYKECINILTVLDLIAESDPFFLSLVAKPHPISLSLDAEPDLILRFYFLYHYIKIIQKLQKILIGSKEKK